jgi:hypothetical protein
MTYTFLRAKRTMELMATSNKCPPALSYNVTLWTSSKREKNPRKMATGGFFLIRGSGSWLESTTPRQKPPKEAVKHLPRAIGGSSVLSACVNERKIAAAYVGRKTLSCNQRRRDVLRGTRQHCDTVSMPRHFLHVSKSESFLVRVQKAPPLSLSVSILL